MLGRGLVAAVCDSARREGWRGPSGRVYEYSIHTRAGAGADAGAYANVALIWASGRGHTDVVRRLLREPRV
jgi:hypothetical protein